MCTTCIHIYTCIHIIHTKRLLGVIARLVVSSSPSPPHPSSSLPVVLISPWGPLEGQKGDHWRRGRRGTTSQPPASLPTYQPPPHQPTNHQPHHQKKTIGNLFWKHFTSLYKDYMYTHTHKYRYMYRHPPCVYNALAFIYTYIHVYI